MSHISLASNVYSRTPKPQRSASGSRLWSNGHIALHGIAMWSASCRAWLIIKHLLRQICIFQKELILFRYINTGKVKSKFISMVIRRNGMMERSRKLEEMFRLHKHLNVEDISVRLWRVSGVFFFLFRSFFSSSPFLLSFIPTAPEAELITECGLLRSRALLLIGSYSPSSARAGVTRWGRRRQPGERWWRLHFHSSRAEQLSRRPFSKSSSSTLYVRAPQPITAVSLVMSGKLNRRRFFFI